MSQTKTIASSQYLTKPRRSSRSRSGSLSSSSKDNRSADAGPEQPYCPIFQPGYAYKIALPSRPKPGQTPWPTSLPPVVLGEASNRQRHASISGPSAVTQPANTVASSSSAASAPVSALPRSRANSMTPFPPVAPPPAGAAPPVAVAVAPPAPASASAQTWKYGLNPLLAPDGGLLWTLRTPISYIKIRASSLSSPGPLTYTHRSLPLLVNRGPLALVIPLPGSSIRVQSDTLGDLLDSLSDALQAQANPAQWAASDQRLAAHAYRTRCGADAAELAKGIKRVDLLGPNAAFAGIAPTMTTNGTYEWVLRVVASA